MKHILLFISIILFTVPQAQSVKEGVKEEIAKLKSAVEAEDYRSAMQIADALIGDGVKEEIRDFAGDVYLYRGIAKYEMGIEEDAIIDLKVAITLNSALKQSYYHIAAIYYDLTSYSSALENSIYFLESNSEDIDGLALKTKCLLKLGELTAAKITIQKAISIKSSEPELYYIRAAVNNALDRTDLACKDATIAMKFGYEEAQQFIDKFCNIGEE